MSLPMKEDFIANLEPVECPICYDSLKNPIKTECGHLFCIECAKRWFESSNTCPSCRQTLFEGPGFKLVGTQWTIEQLALWERSAPRSRLLTVIPRSDDALDYNTWDPLELMDDTEIEFDTNDDVFRETLMDLSFEEDEDDLEEEDEDVAFDRFWNAQPNWHGPTIVTRLRLQSQLKALIMSTTPQRYYSGIGGTASGEALCWNEWAELGRYLEAKLSHLSESQPEQSSRDLNDNLIRGWRAHLETHGLRTPEFDPRLPTDFTWGTFNENVERVITRVVMFAQDVVQRREEMSRSVTEPAQADSVHSLAIQAAELQVSSGDNPGPTLSNEAQNLLETVVDELKKHIITRNSSSYTLIAQALIKASADCRSQLDLYGKLGLGPFDEELCEQVQTLVQAAGCQQEFERI